MLRGLIFLCLAYSVLFIRACCFAVFPSTPESHPNGDAGGLVITTVNQGATADSTHLVGSAALFSPTSKCRADWDSRFDDLISDAQATLRQKVILSELRAPRIVMVLSQVSDLLDDPESPMETPPLARGKSNLSLLIDQLEAAVVNPALSSQQPENSLMGVGLQHAPGTSDSPPALWEELEACLLVESKSGEADTLRQRASEAEGALAELRKVCYVPNFEPSPTYAVWVFAET